jgi:DNA-binding NtrC family response regulator
VDLVVTDVRMPGLNGMEALRAIKELNPEIVVIIMTAFGSIDQAVQAVKDGAYDYINKPFKIDEMLLTILSSIEGKTLGEASRDDLLLLCCGLMGLNQLRELLISDLYAYIIEMTR